MSIAHIITRGIGPDAAIKGIITAGILSAGGGGNAPTDIALSYNACYSTSGINSAIGTLSSTDIDPGDTFTYTLVSGAGSTNNASFNVSGSNLRCSDPLTLGAGTYSVRVRTTDSYTLTFEKAFTVYVLSPPSANGSGLVRALIYPLVNAVVRIKPE